MELTFKQAKALGTLEFIRKFSNSAKYLVPLISFLVILLVVAGCSVFSFSKETYKSEYIIPENVSGNLTIESDGVFIGNLRIEKVDNTTTFNDDWLVIPILLPAIGMVGILLWYDNDKQRYAEDYAEYYIQNKKLRE